MAKTATTESKEKQPAPRKEYTLKLPEEGVLEGDVLLVQGGKELFAGDKVKLTRSQAERLKDRLA